MPFPQSFLDELMARSDIDVYKRQVLTSAKCPSQ